jgi:hypothetical protein
MSLTSYRAAPPRVTVFGICRPGQPGLFCLSVLEGVAFCGRTGRCSTLRHRDRWHLPGLVCSGMTWAAFAAREPPHRAVCREEKIDFMHLADLAATYSPAS